MKKRDFVRGAEAMDPIFSIQDRTAAFDYVLSVTRPCRRIISLVQVGSGAQGYHDEWSDLDFVVALDSDDAMAEVMAYMHHKISGEYRLLFFNQDESRHLQCYLLSNLLEIDIGYGAYEHAAAWKPAFRVLYDRSGVVEEKMVRSRAWMDDRIYGEKQRKDIDAACRSVWIRLMHAAVAIHRGQYLRAVGEMESVRRQYIDLLGDRYRLESSLNREIDRLPETEKAAIRSTFVMGESPSELWRGLENLTALVYKELESCDVSVPQELLHAYYAGLR